MNAAKSLEARLRARALACIAQREHSRVELRAKLVAYLDRQRRLAQAAGLAGPRAHEAIGEGDEADEADVVDAADQAGLVGEAQVDALLDALIARDLLSDERFVEVRVRARAARLGQRRVQQELSRHGLVLDAGADRALRETEPMRAQALWLRRFGAVASDPAQRAKQMRFLLARGFDADVARRVVAGAGPVEGHDAEAC